MKIVGCLPWYDESPSWLAAAVSSACGFCDHVVAVDGAYALFPGGERSSGVEQHETIRETALASGRGVTVHVPSDVWWGNEVEKRTTMLRLALEVATSPDDWLFVFDADVVARVVPADLAEQLAKAAADGFNVAGVSLIERHDLAAWPQLRELVLPTHGVSPMHRMFYRALPGLRVEGQHWCYVAGYDDDRRVLWGRPELGPEPAADFGFVKIEHRSHLRDLGRRTRAKGYYAARDAMKIERIGISLVEGIDGELHEVP